ncbi:MAG: DUF3048 domain-containing protein [Lachnospiraceae bacterium]|nr:DUF3048 domain-containing protein [Lachnospiraceae bacterium]
MKKTKRKNALLIGAIAASLLLSGCGKKQETEEVTTTQSAIDIKPISTMDGNASDITVISRDGYVLSELTGEWIDEKYANQKPFCIMINNISEAMPQSGLSQAAITYEILVEGGITRFLCVFDQYDNIEKLGPIRSARVPYVQLSKMYDGFFAHYGWSPTAQEMIESDPGIYTLNGIYLGDIMYYRSSDKPAPHNVFTNSDLIASGIDYKGYDYQHTNSYEKMFSFNTKDTPLGTGNTANRITTSFTVERAPYFEYNPDDQRYYRFQYGGPQIDAVTGEQLNYKNVLVMMVEYTSDETGYYRFVSWRDCDLYAYYLTDGEYEIVKWRMVNGVPKYFHDDGTELKLNPGNTFITIFDYTIPAAIVVE